MYRYNTFETKSELFFFFFYFVKFYPLGPSPFLKYFLYKHVWVKFLIFQGLLFLFQLVCEIVLQIWYMYRYKFVIHILPDLYKTRIKQWQNF
jgi:hypothetical protein